MTFRTIQRFSEAEATLAVSVLRMQNIPEAQDLATKIERILRIDLEHHEADMAADQALADSRAARAANATLTARQAECLAAVRAGKNAGNRWASRFGGASRWEHGGSNMGGAISRMVQTLQEEGLLDMRRKLTTGGAARLAAWEAANPSKAGWLVGP